MRNRRCAYAALSTDHGDNSTDRLGVRRRKQGADGPYDIERPDRRNQIFAHAAARQLAIECDVIDASHDNNACAGVTDFRQLVEPAENIGGARIGFDQDNVRCG